MFGRNSTKHWFIQQCGFEVIKPALSDWSFDSALKEAQKAYDECKPHVIVASSRGAAVAMAMETGKTPLVLLAPAWKSFGIAPKVKRNCLVIHSKNDEWVPYQDSVELCSKNGCTLLAAGDGHRLNDINGRKALAWALTAWVERHES